MKKILLAFSLICFAFAPLVANSFNSPDFGISKLALRDISENSDSDSNSEVEGEETETTPYKSTKKLRGWSHGLILGMSIANADVTLKGDGGKLDSELTAVDFQVGGVSMNLANGFTLKYDYNIGVGSSDDINKGVDQSGFDMSFNFALGWSPLRKEHFRLAFLGNLGFSMDYISGDKPYVARNGNTYTGEASDFLWNFNLGFDILAIVQFDKHFGLYFDFAFKGIVGGSDTYTFTDVPGNKYNSDYDISGSRVIPSFGFVICF
ncbi:hypothetical protein [Treponema sp.]|uniref:hypothetical protein n=1 Tax=Treponema sp. TaxID=166 RepID=UPI0025E7AE66|nr:hypothetical protein [Treponema sp.]MBR4321303.1 hypothetical protein [Treponema sp.]